MSFFPGAKPPAHISLEPHWFLVHSKGVVVRAEGDAVVLPRHADLLSLGLDPAQAHYIGRLDDQDCFALSIDAAEPGEPWAPRGLRSLYAPFGDDKFVAAGRAVQRVAFADTHRFCGRCAGPTRPVAGEASVRCDRCELSFYPRIAPAIIVLIRRGDQALLARAGRFPEGMYSTLAGFVEMGESLEQTLRREVREEVAIEVTRIRYFGSQPWPFPHSLMLGFTADYASGEIRVDGEEIVDAGWFSREALPNLPPNPSIARKLIDAWLKEVGA
ncbi:MAG TPA: NAD(+) diphosphatase [Polyangiaceae bacterium]|nr:NAD(+) diphosphatase [Polyangiaceae bacterium]